MSRSINLPQTRDCFHYERLLAHKEYPSFPAKAFSGSTFDIYEYLKKHDFDQPFLIEGNSPSFGLRLPKSDVTMSDIAASVGSDYGVRLMDVGLQTDIHGYNIAQYAEYLERQAQTSDRGRVLNMISLEVSETELSNSISPPAFVNQIDWIRSVWPLERISNNDFPKVQKYCLAGMKGSYTDFHIDFGGTSVWYHIVRGAKRFFLIPPTIENLTAFQYWSSSSNQDTQFFGDCVNECFILDLKPGQTLIIPSCWIHSQLQAFQIERSLKVDKECLFPEFKIIHAYFLCETLPTMQDMCHLSQRELSSIVITSDESTCDDWISNDSTVAVEFNNISKQSISEKDDFNEIIDCWWEVITTLSELLNSKLASGIENRKTSKINWKKGKLLFDEKSTGIHLSCCMEKSVSVADSTKFEVNASRKRQRHQNGSAVYMDEDEGEKSDYDVPVDFLPSSDDELSLSEILELSAPHSAILNDNRKPSEKKTKKRGGVRDRIRTILSKR